MIDDPRDLYQAMADLRRENRAFVLATVIDVASSAPREVGAKMLVLPDGSIVGTVGGGRIEQVVIEAMRETLADGKARVVKKHLAHDLGMCCGGEMEVFVEPIEARPKLVLFGAGHVARPTAALAQTVGFSVTVVDPREDQATEERFPDATRVVAEPAEAVKSGVLPFGPETFVLVVTHDHRLDEEALAACLDRPHRYLGMIGSRRKVIRIYQRIRHRRPDAPLDGVHAPVGLDLGALTPDEIAVSIVAELVAVRRGGSGAAMRLDPSLVPEEPAVANDATGTGTERS